MKIDKFSNSWYQILQIILNGNAGFIKVSKSRFGEFMSFLEIKERYEDCAFLLKNKTKIIYE